MTWVFVAFLVFLCLEQIHADAGIDKVVKPGSLAGIEKGKATSACEECKKVMSVLRVAKEITAKEYAHGLELRNIRNSLKNVKPIHFTCAGTCAGRYWEKNVQPNAICRNKATKGGLAENACGRCLGRGLFSRCSKVVGGKVVELKKNGEGTMQPPEEIETHPILRQLLEEDDFPGEGKTLANLGGKR